MILEISDMNKTLYEWCYENKIRPLNHLRENGLSEYDFMCVKFSESQYKSLLNGFDFEENKYPIKPEKYLEYRMYGLVPYNISDIQKGIQYDHAKDNYVLEYGNEVTYQTFLKEWKTTIILNGGTSNEGTIIRQGFKDVTYYGTMQKYLTELKDNGIKVSTFYEPDLNSMLTAIVFLVDERVFNKRVYPDFEALELTDEYILNYEQYKIDNSLKYNKWITEIGGEKNAFLKTFLSDKKLA